MLIVSAINVFVICGRAVTVMLLLFIIILPFFTILPFFIIFIISTISIISIVFVLIIFTWPIFDLLASSTTTSSITVPL